MAQSRVEYRRLLTTWLSPGDRRVDFWPP